MECINVGMSNVRRVSVSPCDFADHEARESGPRAELLQGGCAK